MAIQILCPFLNQVILLLSFRSSLYMLSINFLSAAWFADIFSHGFPFLLFYSVFMMHNILKFLWCSFFLIFPLLPVPLVSYLRNHCQIQCHEAVVLYSVKSFIVFGLTIRSLIHFELVFINGAGKNPTSFIYMCTSSFPSMMCSKYCSFPLKGLGIFVRNHLTIYVRVYFWALCLLRLAIHLYLC